MRHHVTFIGAATSWGAAYRGPEQAPMVLWASNLAEGAMRPHVTVDWHGILEPAGEAPDHDMPLHEAYEAILITSRAIAREVSEVLAEQPLTMPVVIGGDHSVAFGTWSGVITAYDAFGQFGLLWIDAHMDGHTPITSATGKWGGHFHAMPLAHLLGHGDKALCELGSKKTKLKGKHVAMVGLRSYEEAEEKLLRSEGVTIFTMDDIKKLGLNEVMKRAFAIVGAAPKGFGVSLDMDVFDPKDMPGVGTPEKNGIRVEEFLQTWSALKLPGRPKAVEIVEYVPGKDPKGKGLAAIEKFLWVLLKK